MWYQATRKAVADNQLAVIAIAQEQHFERTRLYAQWKQLEGWDIVHDPLNQFGIDVVPLAIAINADGVVESWRANQAFLEKWLGATDSREVNEPKGAAEPMITTEPGDEMVLWPETRDLTAAIDRYEQTLADQPDRPELHFRKGVVYRKRFDAGGDMVDFQNAVDSWNRALALNPNQYIYRRRIQQYGPRTDKPYPFYDWVAEAIEDVRQRGETPVVLVVPLTESERAKPVRRFAPGDGADVHPDPGNRIRRDSRLDIRTVVVPPRVGPADTGRLHLQVSIADSAKWNNEGGPLKVWIDPCDGVSLAAHHLEAATAKAPQSSEPRGLEFEFQIAPEVRRETLQLSGFILAPVCENETGQCHFVRKDFIIDVKVDQ